MATLERPQHAGVVPSGTTSRGPQELKPALAWALCSCRPQRGDCRVSGHCTGSEETRAQGLGMEAQGMTRGDAQAQEEDPGVQA